MCCETLHRNHHYQLPKECLLSASPRPPQLPQGAWHNQKGGQEKAWQPMTIARGILPSFHTRMEEKHFQHFSTCTAVQGLVHLASCLGANFLPSRMSWTEIICSNPKKKIWSSISMYLWITEETYTLYVLPASYVILPHGWLKYLVRNRSRKKQTGIRQL